jgi:two-component system, OmpR family, sensor kinase
MPIRSIRARLTFWYSALLTLTFLILGGAGYGLLVYNLAHDLDTALSGVAKVLAEQAGRSGGPPFSAEIDEVFRRFFGFSPWQRHFEVIPPPGFPERRLPPGSGRFPLSPQARENALRGIPTFETVRGPASGPVRLLTMPVAEGGRVASLIQVGMSLEMTENTKRRFLLTMAALLPLGLLLAGGGGWALARRALRPVDQIAETARRISAERLDARLEETGANDELSRLIRTLNGMLERLDASFHQVRRFSADASHELQTPLTILKGEIEVALRSPRTPGQYQEILTSSLEEIDRLTRLVEGLMLLARADAGVLRLDAKPIPLDQLARDVCGQAQRLAETRRVTLALEEAEPLTILGDPDRLRQVLLNLADNGIKYTPAGGRVAVSLQREGSWACLRVADTGIGLSPEEQKRVFDRFYRSPEAKSQGDGGAGLGLCIARSVVEAHGGKIQVESAPGKGSTFAVFLPLPA